MHRSVRPKSAKGKMRPEPPPRPRQGGSTAGPSTSRSSHEPTSTAAVAAKKQAVKVNNPREQKAEPIRAPDPPDFPEISRPVSSLSRYDILPRIPSTPGLGDGRTSGPVESEIELDLMSSFAQQMILDSTQMNQCPPDSLKASKPLNPVPPKRGVPSTTISRENGLHNQDSPAHKKSRTTVTKSVFGPRITRPGRRTLHMEPKASEPRLKLAIKLPDGKRVERFFAPASSINDVMHFVQTKMRIPIKRCDIYSMLQVPKVLIRNWKQTLEQLDMRDRTMLYIEEKD